MNRSREITELIARTFAVAESDARIEAARRNVDAEAVALEQYFIWFNAGYYTRAKAFWFENVEKA